MCARADVVCSVWVGVCSLFPLLLDAVYVLDDSQGMGRRFDGVGAISGGGATSKLLMNYPDEERSQILDFLFKPQFGASLQILKVEIGGDSQSTDGSEASHMHSKSDLNFRRGYEWWLMKEAKKRNPSILLYGLPWVFPGWLGGKNFNPYSNRSYLVVYILQWLRGAKDVHNLTIDFIGIWNERAYDAEYIKMLRRALDQDGFAHVQIVVADGEWDIVDDLVKDPDLLAAVGIVGAHYPGSHSPAKALDLQRPLWASEEFSAYNDQSGGGCWSRVPAESYVNGNLTAAIAWNLLAGYYDDLPYPRSGLMTANQPWSGHYFVNTPIWTTAHYTQFTQPGWRFLRHGAGAGNLTNNGSYVSMRSPDLKHLTVVIETMDAGKVPCFYPMPKYPIRPQAATFQLQGSLANITTLYVWYSRLDFVNSSDSVLFSKKSPIKVSGGKFTLQLGLNEVYTLTTDSQAGFKGSYPSPPPWSPFPLPYEDDFEGYEDHGEAFNLAQQAGVFEVLPSGDGKVLAQTVPQPPVDTCRPLKMPRPVALIGNFKWTAIRVQVRVLVPRPPEGSSGVFVAARVDRGGCNTMYADGVFFWLFPHNQTAAITANYSSSAVLARQTVQVDYDTWYTLTLDVKETKVKALLDGREIFSLEHQTTVSPNGFVAIGTETFALAYFDNLKISQSLLPKSDLKYLVQDLFTYINSAQIKGEPLS